MLYIEKIIEWGKKKGYDDFYLTKVVSNIVTDYIPLGTFMAFVMGIFLVAILFAVILNTLGLNTLGELKWLILILFQFFILFIPGILFILPLIILGISATSGNMTLKNQEKKGIREDIREATFWKNSMAKFAIRVIRNVPKHCNWLFRISVIIPIITIIISIVIFSSSECGWGVMSFLLAYLVLYFLIIRFVLKKFIPLYKKYLARVEKEGWYFVNWKVDQDIEHYEEWVSGHEEWWTDEAILNFDKFIKDKHRIFPFSSFVFTYTWLFVWLMWTLSVSIGATPLGAFYCYKMMFEETKTEEVIESVDDKIMSNEKDKDDSIEDGETYEDEDEEMEEIEEKEEIVDEDISTGTDQYTQVQEDNSCYELYDLDVNPQYSGRSDHFKIGIMDYISKTVPNAIERRVYVEFKINKQGKIFDIDALTSDAELENQIKNALVSMPALKPGEVNGKPVNVKTNIKFE